MYEFTHQLINQMFLLENVENVATSPNKPMIQAPDCMDEAVTLVSSGRVTRI